MLRLGLWANDDFVLRDEVEAGDIEGGLVIRHDDQVGFLYGDAKPMMMIVALEPVVWMVPVCEIAKIAHLNYLAAFFVYILFHVTAV